MPAECKTQWTQRILEDFQAVCSHVFGCLVGLRRSLFIATPTAVLLCVFFFFFIYFFIFFSELGFGLVALCIKGGVRLVQVCPCWRVSYLFGVQRVVAAFPVQFLEKLIPLEFQLCLVYCKEGGFPCAEFPVDWCRLPVFNQAILEALPAGFLGRANLAPNADPCACLTLPLCQTQF